MSQPPLRTVIAGFGGIAHANADDPAQRKHFRYATHVQVLREHPLFAWTGTIDPDPGQRAAARTRWGLEAVAATADALAERERVDVLVLATRPGNRLALLDAFPNLRAVLVEKPLGNDLDEATAFVERARERGILVQVNLLRRTDATTRRLAAAGIETHLGRVQAASAIYGNGLNNNGTHLIDLARMLLGETVAVQAFPSPRARFVEGPLTDDVNVPFVLELASGLPVFFSVVRFAAYREIALEVWGERARLTYAHGGLVARIHHVIPGKVPGGTFEVEADASETLPATLGDAFFTMYSNLADAVAGRAALLSPGDSALRTATVVDAVRRSSDNHGTRVTVP